MTEPTPAKPTASAQMYVWWSLVNMFLAVIAIGVTLYTFMQERDLRGEIVRLSAAKACPPKVLVSATPKIVEDAPVPAPPQDQAKSGYIGSSGTSILPAMTLELEALRGDKPDGPAETIRLGSQQVLPSRTIHVVNLWATWCSPCLEELPDFKAMFARRPEWGDRVRFVPIMLKDAAAPAAAYRDKVMPEAPFKLADRGLGDPLAEILAADKQRELFKGNLPVTLVLDCNRRVRWAQFDKLEGAQFKELEGYIDRFIEEIDDKSPGSWCTRVWDGNGRCEGNESSEKNHSLADCGPLKKSNDNSGTTPAEPLPPVQEECPANMIRSADGKCVRKLRGEPTATKKPPTTTTCGNDKCEPGESSSTCCLDCKCTDPLVCRQTRDGSSKCMVKGLK